MMTSEDITRIKRGPADLEERIEQLIKQKEILKSACRKAGRRIEELEGELAIVKGPADLEERIEQLEKQKELLKFHCKKAATRIKELERDREFLKRDIDRLTEDKLNLETILRK